MTTYTYRSTIVRRTGEVSRDWVQRSDGLFIGRDPWAEPWKAYQQWLAAGNAPAPAAGLYEPTPTQAA